MHDDRIGGLLRKFGAAQGASGEPLLGIGGGVLVGDLGERQPLHADAEPRLVHHREHRLQAAVRLAHEPTGRGVVIHHAGRIAVDAHLLFDRTAGHRIARAERAVGGGQEFRHDEQRQSARALRCAVDAGQHEMNDVLDQIVLAGGDEDLGAGNFVAAVRLRRRAGAHQAEIGAALRLGEVHCAGPLPGDELGQVQRFLLRRRVGDNRRDRPLGEARIHPESHIRRAEKFVDGLRQHHRQALPAEFGGRRNPDPAARGEPLIGVLKSGRRRDGAVVVAAAALLIANPVERGEHFLAEFCRFSEHRFDEIGRRLGKAGQVVVAVDMKHLAQQKHHVVDGSLIGRHDVPPRRPPAAVRRPT